MRLYDTSDGYGWISIALHWASAFIVLAIWFIGDSIGAAGTEGRDGLLRFHTTLALSAYALLWLRIVWRLRHGHPGPLPDQGGLSHRLAVVVHLGILGALAVLLVSGPVMAWAGGLPVRMFDWVIAAPFAPNQPLFATAHALHETAGAVVVAGVGLHLAGVVKHLALNRDRTFAKMMVAAPPPAAAERIGARRQRRRAW